MASFIAHQQVRMGWFAAPACAEEKVVQSKKKTLIPETMLDALNAWGAYRESTMSFSREHCDVSAVGLTKQIYCLDKDIYLD